MSDEVIELAGRVGPHRESHEPRLTALSLLADGVTPVAGYLKFNVAPSIGSKWGMAHNADLGCCGFSGWQHYNAAKAAANGEDWKNASTTTWLPAFHTLVPAYYAYGEAQGEGPRADEGVSNAAMLAWAYKLGLIYGYAEVPIEYADWFAMTFNGALVGQVLDGPTAISDFNARPRKTWRAMGRSDGHDTLLEEGGGEGGGAEITWGGVQPFDVTYRETNWTDVWVIYDKEDSNVNHAALQTILTEMHGVVTEESIIAELSGTPTTAQLQADNLVPLTTYDGEPVRKYDSVHRNFPPTTVYVTPPTPTPTPPPTPPVTTQPSGIAITPVAAGYTRALLDDMLGTSLSAANWTDGGSDVAYNGLSEGTDTGFFIKGHVVVENSVAHFQAYQDPTNIVKCWEYTAAAAAHVSNWAGAGTHSKILVGPGSVTRVFMKYTPYPGVAPMAILFGNLTEFDFAETNDISTKGQAISKIYGSVHWSNHTEQESFNIVAPTNVDFSQWGVFEAQFTSTALVVLHSTDGINYVEVGRYTFTAAQLASDILSKQPLCIQIQTGDVMANPAPDASVTAQSPVELLVDWVTVDVLA